ncbi:MAG: hypothetical protein ACRELG_27660 [Gemmataceae bacterium]
MFFHADYRRETLSDRQSPTVTALDDGTEFPTEGITPSRNQLAVGVEGTARISRRLDGFIDYDALLPVGNTTENSFTVGVRMTF